MSIAKMDKHCATNQVPFLKARLLQHGRVYPHKVYTVVHTSRESWQLVLLTYQLPVSAASHDVHNWYVQKLYLPHDESETYTTCSIASIQYWVWYSEKLCKMVYCQNTHTWQNRKRELQPKNYSDECYLIQLLDLWTWGPKKWESILSWALPMYIRTHSLKIKSSLQVGLQSTLIKAGEKIMTTKIPLKHVVSRHNVVPHNKAAQFVNTLVQQLFCGKDGLSTLQKRPANHIFPNSALCPDNRSLHFLW